MPDVAAPSSLPPVTGKVLGVPTGVGLDVVEVTPADEATVAAGVTAVVVETVVASTVGACAAPAAVVGASVAEATVGVTAVTSAVGAAVAASVVGASVATSAVGASVAAAVVGACATDSVGWVCAWPTSIVGTCSAPVPLLGVANSLDPVVDAGPLVAQAANRMLTLASVANTFHGTVMDLNMSLLFHTITYSEPVLFSIRYISLGK